MCRYAGRGWPPLSRAVDAVLDLHTLQGGPAFGTCGAVIALNPVLRSPTHSSFFTSRRSPYSLHPPPPLPHLHAPTLARRRGSPVGSIASLRLRAGAVVEVGCSAVSLARPCAGTTKRDPSSLRFSAVASPNTVTLGPHSPSVQLPSVSPGTPGPAL